MNNEMALTEEIKDLKAQINKLAKFIMEKVEGEPSENEGAVDCAIRIIRTHQQALNECGMTASAMIDFVSDDWENAAEFKRSLNHLMELGLEAGKCPLPQEVLFMFMAWLTMRKESITLGASHLVPPGIELIEKYIEANGWGECREGFEKLIKHPEE